MKILNFKYQISKGQLLLFAIFLTALFFRIYKLDTFYIFEHDQDLYSWIVKDIWVDHHLRIIGQLTSIEGVFIGPMFYYLLVPFYVISGMNPLSATWLAALIGLITVGSIYWVFRQFFNQTVGLLGAAIYATSLGPVFFDRWVVPTLPTMLWCIWLLYTCFALAEGKTKSLIIGAILLGLIWHIHIALLPLMPLLVLSFFLAKQRLTLKIIGLSLVIVGILTVPFWLFEFKHQFLQTRSLLFSSGADGQILKGQERFLKIIQAFAKILNSALFQDWNLPILFTPIISILLIFFSFLKKLLTIRQTIIVISWVILVFAAQQITHHPISEYYIVNITILPILFLALILNYFYQNLGYKKLVTSLIVIYMVFNAYILINKPEPWHLYANKKAAIDFIHQDYLQHGYQCASINFIAKYGTAVGFRYPVWWEGIHQIHQNSKTPNYTVVIPYDAVNKNELDGQFKYFGVILPKNQDIDSNVCKDSQYNLIPLLGFTN